MRTIKFRAWNIGGKCMVNKIANDDLGWVLDNPKSYVPMQYTGQKDKNGKEIFEGDIIYSSHVDDQKTGPVKWSNIHHGYIIDYPRRKGDSFDQWQHMHGKEHCYEVVGNIYENKELLK